MEKLFIFMVLWLGFGLTCARSARSIDLPEPRKKGTVSVEEAIAKRRTVRDFDSRPITLEQLSTLCWAAQGITTGPGEIPKRAAPSAGALYPIFVYVAVGEGMVEGLVAGVYKYVPKGHKLELVKEGDKRNAIARAALEQMWMRHAAVTFVIAANYNRITPKYGRRGITYAHIEAGHVAENIILEAAALGLGAGIVGAFVDDAIAQEVNISKNEVPLLILPVGHVKK